MNDSDWFTELARATRSESPVDAALRLKVRTIAVPILPLFVRFMPEMTSATWRPWRLAGEASEIKASSPEIWFLTTIASPTA